MKRWLLTLAVLLGAATAVSRADYYMIRVILGGDPQMARGGTGGGGTVGEGGAPGTGYGQGAGPGMGGRMPPPGMPGGGAGGGQGYGQGQGMAGRQPPAGMGGAGGASGGGGQGYGSAMGMGGRQPPPGMGGGTGAGGRQPPGGATGGGGGSDGAGGTGVGGLRPGGFGQGGAGGQSGPADVDLPYVSVVVEKLGDDANIYGPMIKHKWGKSNLFHDGTTVQIFRVEMQTVSAQFAKKHKALEAKKTPDKLYELADWALQHGLVDECGKILDELVAEAAKTKEQSANTQAVVAAYTALKPKLDASPARPRSTDGWKQRLGFKLYTGNHYDILFSAESSDPTPEVKSREINLERNYRGFFYWFALKGIAVTPPAEKMLVVVVDKANVFAAKRLDYDDSPLTERFLEMRAGDDKGAATLTLAGPTGGGDEKASGMLPLYSDGFLARRDNVMFLSSSRLDSASVEFAAKVQGFVRQGWDRHECLAGKGLTMDVVKKITDPNERKQMVSYVHTLMLVDQALSEEAELAAISYEGTRQLLAATSIQPRTLQLPEWLQFGFASTFDTPKGPYPASHGLGKLAYWHGYGGPSWNYLRQFKVWKDTGKLEPAAVMLKKVVTDAYYLDSKAGSDKEALHKARTMAWALSFYLAKDKLPALQKFNAELANLPRDLELNPDTIVDCFARSFGLAGANGEIDAAAWTKFAQEWVDALNLVQPPAQDTPIEDPNPPQGLTPGSPRQPGGGGGNTGGGSNPG